MSYLKLIAIFLILISYSCGGFAASHKKQRRDILAETLKNPPRLSHFSKQKHSKSKNRQKKSTKISEKEKPKKEESKKSSKKSSADKKSDSGNDAKKDEKKEEKKEAKVKKKDKEITKNSYERKGPRRFFLPPPPDEPIPVALTKEQDRMINQKVYDGKFEEALFLYCQSGATLQLEENESIDVLNTTGLSDGTAGIQFMRYLELKKDKKPVIIKTKRPEIVENFIQNNCEHLWVSRNRDNIEISFKGSTITQAAKKYQKLDFSGNSPEEMICIRALKNDYNVKYSQNAKTEKEEADLLN